MDVANYYVALKEQMSGPAAAADSAMGKLDATIKKMAAPLGVMEQNLAKAKAKLAELQQGFGGKVDIGAVNKAKDGISALQAKIGEKRGELGSLQTAKAQLAEVGEESVKAGGAFDVLKDKMPQLDGNLGKVQSALAKLGPAGVVVAAVFAVVTIAATVLIGTLLKLASAAISLSQQKAALVETFGALSRGGQSGAIVASNVATVAASLPFTIEQTNTWARSLLSVGVNGDKLAGHLRGIASAAALMGSEGGAAAEDLLKQLAKGGATGAAASMAIRAKTGDAAESLAKMGLTAEDLARALGTTPEGMRRMTVGADRMGNALQAALIAKGARSLEALGLTWTSITGKLGDSWNDLFSGMSEAINPFMAEVKSLFGEFSAGGASQSLLKSVLVSFFTTLLAIATRVTRAIHLGFLQVEIALLKVYIACAPVINAIREFVSSAEFLDGAVIVLKAIAITLALIIAPILFITVAFGVMVAVVVGAVMAIVAGVIWFVGAMNSAGPAIKATIVGWATSFYDAAGQCVAALVNAFNNGKAAVMSAVTSLASSVSDAFKSALGIHSPSRVFYAHGIFTAEGAEMGINDGAAGVEASARDMADGAAEAGKPSAKGSRSTVSASSGGNHYEIHNHFAPGTPQDVQSMVETAIRKVLEMAGNAEPMPS